MITLLLLLRAIDYLLVLSSLFAAGAIWVLRRRFDHPSVLAAAGLATLGIAGYATFWAWFLSVRLGYCVSLLIPLACGAYGAWRFRFLLPSDRRLLLQTAKAWLLAFCASIVVLASGFLYGGVAQPLLTARSRFSHTLAADNELPLTLAEQMEQGRILHPMAADWLSSDRPPLQTGLTLLIRPFRAGPRTLTYMINAVFLQCLWIPALWALLQSFQVRGRVLVWTIAAAFFSGFNLLNSFYTWPKLLSAAFVLAALGLLPAPEGEVPKRGQRIPGLLCGALIALSLLSHGGNMFLLLGLGLGYLFLWKRWPMHQLLPAAAAFFVLYLPWMTYQKLYDPPGDRLLKMHLAGVNDPDPRSFVAVTREAYSRLTPAQILETRLSNVNAALDHQREYWQSLGALVLATSRADGDGTQAAAKRQRQLQFFHLAPTLGLFMGGPVLLLAAFVPRFRTPLLAVAAQFWLVVFCTVAVWCLLMFAPASAVIHQGSYAVVVLAFAGALLSLWNLSALLARTIVVIQAALTALVYVGFVPGVLHVPEVILLFVALAGLLWTLRWISMEPQNS